MIKKIFILTILLFQISLCDIYPSYYNSSGLARIDNRSDNLKLLLGIMVEFKEEEIDDPLTTGDGTFLESADLSYINYDDISKCTSTLIDSPPHDRGYFEAQLKAVKNYYHSVTLGNIDLDIHMLDEIYELSDYMQQYSYSDIHITNLFKETVDLAKEDILNYVENQYTSDEFIIVVFHAGLGQDISTSGGFDPTIYDIHSAYIDDIMLLNASNNQESEIELNSNIKISDGIILPETLNMIYYDIIEDIVPISFVNVEDLENLYCDIQLGMTGLFAYLLGYRLGFPPMHNTENILPITRIGKFGLMDQGSNNGRGIIPAPPHVFSRIHNQNINQEAIDITNNVVSSLTSISKNIPKYSLNEPESIFRISINNFEYFLLENRNNIIKGNSVLLDDEYTISDLVNYLNCDPIISGQENPYCNIDVQDDLKNKIPLDNYSWIDVISYVFDSELEIENGVITKFPDYDYGLPGSGILIWHVNENYSNNLEYGFNNDLDNRFIQLEEADGVVHIGYPDPDPFQRGVVPYGWKYDFWYRDNVAYEDINNAELIYFNNSSMPSSRTHENINSNISIKVSSTLGSDNMYVTFSYENDLINLVNDDSSVKILGALNDEVYFLNGSNVNNQPDLGIFKKNLISGEVSVNEEVLTCPSFDALCNICKIDGFDWYDSMIAYNNELCIIDDQYYLDINTFQLESGSINPIGFLVENDLQNGPSNFTDVQYNTNYSLADIDSDGLDEFISVNNGSLDVKNYENNSSVSGFPLHNGYIGSALIADLLNGDEPEIICATNNSIDILSHMGDIIQTYPLYDSNQSLFLTESNNSMYLINGNYYIKFDKYNDDSNYWLNSFSTTYNYPMVTGLSQESRQSLILNNNSSNQFGIDVSKSFNYPNPFEQSTNFRFYVGLSDFVNISIYDILGVLIDEIKVASLIHNEFNEYYYSTSKLDPGVYIGQIKSDKGEVKIIKMLKTK